jgi:hypothetical protein
LVDCRREEHSKRRYSVSYRQKFHRLENQIAQTPPMVMQVKQPVDFAGNVSAA